MTTGYATDTLSNFHDVIGSNHADTITGTVGNDGPVIGGSGNNYIYIYSPVWMRLNGGVGGTNTLISQLPPMHRPSI